MSPDVDAIAREVLLSTDPLPEALGDATRGVKVQVQWHARNRGFTIEGAWADAREADTASRQAAADRPTLDAIVAGARRG